MGLFYFTIILFVNIVFVYFILDLLDLFLLNFFLSFFFFLHLNPNSDRIGNKIEVVLNLELEDGGHGVLS